MAALALAVVSLPASPWSAGEPALQVRAGGVSRFTTASVTRSKEFVNVHPTVTDGRFVWRAAPLVVAIAYAYEATLPTIHGKVPLEPFYDIDATFPAAATPRDIRAMVKNLLIDQFALRVHNQTRRMPLFRLVPETGGHKLGGAANRIPMVKGTPLAPGQIAMFSDQRGWHFVGARVTVRQIAGALADRLDLPVIDATGVNGTFDVDVVQQADNDRTFLEAVPRQLGLKLEQAVGNVDVLVIDGFSMP